MEAKFDLFNELMRSFLAESTRKYLHKQKHGLLFGELYSLEQTLRYVVSKTRKTCYVEVTRASKNL